MRATKHFLMEDEAQDLIEWSLLATFIAIAVAFLLFSFKEPLLGVYQGILDTLNEMSNKV